MIYIFTFTLMLQIENHQQIRISSHTNLCDNNDPTTTSSPYVGKAQLI